MKKYMKIFMLSFITLGLITACSSKVDVPEIDVPIVDVEDDFEIDSEIPEVEDEDIDVEEDNLEGAPDANTNDSVGSDDLFDKGKLSNKQLEDLAIDVIEGKWGTGSEIESKLAAAGYDFEEVNNEVSKIREVLASALNRPVRPSTPEDNGSGSSNGGVSTPGGTSGQPSKPSNPGGDSNTVDKGDTVAPLILLNGSSKITIEVGEKYSDPGATVSDNVDSGLKAKAEYFTEGRLVSKVDTGFTGVYEIKYTASDKAGNQAEPVIRTVTVIKKAVTVMDIAPLKSITVEQGASYKLPEFANVNLSNSESRKAIVKWDEGHSSRDLGEFTIQGTVDLSLLDEVKETSMKAEIKLIVKAYDAVEAKVDTNRIKDGDVKLSDLDIKPATGRVNITTKYTLDKDSYISGKPKDDLRTQGGNPNRVDGVGYASIGIVAPKQDATHVEVTVSSKTGAEDARVYTDISEVDIMSEGKGINLYLDAANEVNERLVFSEGSGNWAPVEGSKNQYTIKWFIGSPNSSGRLVAIDKLDIDVINNYKLDSNQINDSKFTNELRKIRKTLDWIDELRDGKELSLVEAGFYRPFLVDSSAGKSSVNLSYYNKDGIINSKSVEVMDPVLSPLPGSQEILNGQIKNKFWYGALDIINDGEELPDANLIGAYSPFRIKYEESTADKQSIFFYYDFSGELMSQKVTLTENEIFGLERETEFNQAVHDREWYRYLEANKSFEGTPSVYEIGAYDGFILNEDKIDISKEYKGKYFYYDKVGKLIEGEYKLMDGVIPVRGTLQDVESVVKTEEWFNSLPVYTTEKGTDDAREVGAYTWFKLESDKGHSEEYKAYYYDEIGVRVMSKGDFEFELIFHGTQEEMDSASFTREWWDTIDQFSGTAELKWQEIGAYKWFRYETINEFESNPLEFIAFYFNGDKERVVIAGEFEGVYIDEKGTQDEVDNTIKNNEWYLSLDTVSSQDFSSHWYYMGAYNPFKLEEDFAGAGQYIAHYYSFDKSLIEISGSLEDIIEIHGSEKEILDAEKTKDWVNSLLNFETFNDPNASWLSVGAYKPFTSDDHTEELEDADQFIIFYYNEEKELKQIQERYADAIEIIGSQELIDTTERNYTWFNTMDNYPTLEDDTWKEAGAYVWFKIDEDEGTYNGSKYKAYYYNEHYELIEESDVFEDEIETGGRTEADVNDVEKNREWLRNTIEVDSFNNIESSWLTIGAYQFFQITEVNNSIEDPLQYKAFYYNDEKDLVGVEGYLEEELEVNGTLEDIENTIYTFDWWNKIDSYDRHVDALAEDVGAYKWFRIKDYKELEEGMFIAHYYDLEGEMHTEFGELVSESEGKFSIGLRNNPIFKFRKVSPLTSRHFYSQMGIKPLY